MPDREKTIAHNRKAFHDYAIEERYEAGIALQGSEVKSLREGRANLREAYAMVRDGEAFILGMHIAPYSAASTHVAVDPSRPRKLLLHRSEIDKLAVATQQKGMTLVPLRLYFKSGRAKLELGIARGKRAYDRRHDIAEREAKREIDRARRRQEQGR